MLGDDCLNDSENSYAKSVTNNILEEDGHIVGDITQGVREVRIDVDSVIK